MKKFKNLAAIAAFCIFCLLGSQAQSNDMIMGVDRGEYERVTCRSLSGPDASRIPSGISNEAWVNFLRQQDESFSHPILGRFQPGAEQYQIKFEQCCPSTLVNFCGVRTRTTLQLADQIRTGALPNKKRYFIKCQPNGEMIFHVTQGICDGMENFPHVRHDLTIPKAKIVIEETEFPVFE